MDFNAIVDLVITIFQWIVWAIKFLWSFILTLFWQLSDLFTWILNREFFTVLNDWFVMLSKYLWVSWSIMFVSLFIIAFMVVIASFLFRLLRGRVNYDSTIKKYNKNHPIQ